MEPIYFFYLGRSRIEGRKDNKKGLSKAAMSGILIMLD